jgi:hypothetical protein
MRLKNPMNYVHVVGDRLNGVVKLALGDDYCAGCVAAANISSTHSTRLSIGMVDTFKQEHFGRSD